MNSMKDMRKKFAEGDLSDLIDVVEINRLLRLHPKILNKFEFFFENNLDVYERFYGANDFLTM